MEEETSQVRGKRTVSRRDQEDTRIDLVGALLRDIGVGYQHNRRVTKTKVNDKL